MTNKSFVIHSLQRDEIVKNTIEFVESACPDNVFSWRGIFDFRLYPARGAFGVYMMQDVSVYRDIRTLFAIPKTLIGFREFPIFRLLGHQFVENLFRAVAFAMRIDADADGMFFVLHRSTFSVAHFFPNANPVQRCGNIFHFFVQ